MSESINPDPAAGALRRVVVVGTSCSGKTTVARALASLLSVPHIELDALHWLPEWVERPDDEFRLLVERETAGECWVVDGNYSVVRDIVWPRATAVVWLDYSFPRVLAQALSRTVSRAITREELFSGNRESVRLSFFSRDSILLWVLRTHRRNRAKYGALRDSEEWAHLCFTELRGPAEAERFLSQCQDVSAETSLSA